MSLNSFTGSGVNYNNVKLRNNYEFEMNINVALM
jgi:hypothetical protein